MSDDLTDAALALLLSLQSEQLRDPPILGLILKIERIVYAVHDTNHNDQHRVLVLRYIANIARWLINHQPDLIVSPHGT